MRFILPIILLILSVGLFLEYTNPTYQEMKVAQALAKQYDTALGNARELNKQRDELNNTYRSMSPESLDRLSKLLPDNADNIHLIIDIQRMAESYGMSLSSIKFDAGETTTATGNPQLSAAAAADVSQSAKEYGTFNLQFTTNATYPNFLTFIRDIESSLRLTDIQSVEFSSVDQSKGTTSYTVKLRTYWLKS
jgi:Tfp pilus assembly protein PilO